jgi:hypothetical protein
MRPFSVDISSDRFLGVTRKVENSYEVPTPCTPLLARSALRKWEVSLVFAGSIPALRLMDSWLWGVASSHYSAPGETPLPAPRRLPYGVSDLPNPARGSN